MYSTRHPSDPLNDLTPMENAVRKGNKSVSAQINAAKRKKEDDRIALMEKATARMQMQIDNEDRERSWASSMDLVMRQLNRNAPGAQMGQMGQMGPMMQGQQGQQGQQPITLEMLANKYSSGRSAPQNLDEGEEPARGGPMTFAAGGKVPARPAAPAAPADGVNPNWVDFDAMRAQLSPVSGSQRVVQEAILNDLAAQQAARRAQYESLEAQRNAPASKWDEASRLFKMSAAFAAPSKAGGFGSTIQNLATGIGGYADDMSAANKAKAAIREKQLGLLASNNTKALAELAKTGGAASAYGKQAQDEGLVPGTPEFAKRVRQLNDEHQALLKMKAGGGGAGGLGPDRKFTPQEKKELMGLNENIKTLEGSAKMFARMEELSPKALSGNLAPVQRFLHRNLKGGLKRLSGTTEQEVADTADLDNLIRTQVANTLKATFGGSGISNAERDFLVAMQAREVYSKTERERIIKNLKTLNEEGLKKNRALKNDLISGDVYRLDETEGKAKGGSVKKLKDSPLSQLAAHSFAEGGKTPKPKYDINKQRLASAASGATFGFGDEIYGTAGRAKDFLAGKSAAERDANYERRVAEQRAMLKDYEENHPIESVATNLAGGLLSGGVISKGAVAGAKALANVAPKVASNISGITARYAAKNPRTASIGAKMGEGAIYGGAAGYGNAVNDEVSDTISNAALGAAVNPVVGKVLAAAPNITRGIYRNVKNAGSNAENRATDRIIKSLDLDNVHNPHRDLNALAAKYQRLGIDDAVLADISPRTNKLAEIVAMKASPQQTRFGELFENRIRNERDQAAKRLDTLSGGKSAFDEAEIIRQRMRTAPQPLYEQTFAQFPSIKNEELNYLLTSPAFRGAIKEAQNLGDLQRSNLAAKMRADLRDAKTDSEREKIMNAYNEKVKGTKLPDFLTSKDLDLSGDALDAVMKAETIPTRALDLIKKGLDVSVEKGIKGGTLAKTEARELIEAKNRMIGMVDDATKLTKDMKIGGKDYKIGESLYGKAREAYADDARLDSALQAGRDMFSKTRHRGDEVNKVFSSLKTDEEKQMFRLGAADSLHSAFETGSRNINASKLIADDASVQKKLRPLFKDDADFKKFVEGFTERSQMMRNAQNVVRGSQTAQRLIGDAEFNAPLASDDLLTSLGGVAQLALNPSDAGRWATAGRQGARYLQKVSSPMSEAQAGKAAELLMTPITPQSIQNLQPMLQGRMADLAKREANDAIVNRGAMISAADILAQPEEGSGGYAIGGTVVEPGVGVGPTSGATDYLQRKDLMADIALKNAQMQQMATGTPQPLPLFPQMAQMTQMTPMNQRGPMMASGGRVVDQMPKKKHWVDEHLEKRTYNYAGGGFVRELHYAVGDLVKLSDELSERNERNKRSNAR